MIKLFKTILKAGTPTAKYPFAPYEVNRDFRGKPKYHADQCIACAACTKACPANALVMEVDMETGERRWEISMARCIFCGRCEEVCPTRAIALSPEFELAVTNKADLYEEARFVLAPCTLCGTYFAPSKLVALVEDTLKQAGTPLTTPERLHHCPDCKRKQSMLSQPDSALITPIATPMAAQKEWM
ncbi:formate hydrogenlyase complex iron-sulfur subunit [Aeromonas hydrophila]|uniref:formate hydrogenlyase complex iron-sulfur subunit n=1 Tax=Aeromonas hydrophila TaxID=644 RepID=UPI000D0D0C64|nr:formate hydrogenlyase complex iron-sulfur subunit [Aeromonas hydrophila]AVP84369.1 formate hydrogenlyase complex iron-sulfur subunit [Aeromonas hydrophila]